MFKIILLAIAVCKIGTGTVNAQNDLTTDPALIEIFAAYDNEISKVKDIRKVKEYLADNNLTEAELSDFHKYMGYAYHSDMIDFMDLQDLRMKALIKKYDLMSMPKDKLKQQLERGYLYFTATGFVADECDRQKVNCVAKAAAEALAGHLGCAGADLTIILGIICHGAVTAVHYTESNNCYNAYRRCKGIISQ